MSTALTTEINSTFDELINTLSSFPEAEINLVPFDGSWTAGQVCDHIIKSLSALPYVFNNDITTTERPYEEFVTPITEMFSDHSRKFQSADRIYPSDGPHDKTELLNAFTQLKQTLIDAATTQDLSMTCGSIAFPFYGHLTRREWMAVYITHTQRHTKQLKHIFEVVNT